MQLQPFLILCLTQDLRPFVLAAVLRPRTNERGCILKDRNPFQVELYSHNCLLDGDDWKDYPS